MVVMIVVVMMMSWRKLDQETATKYPEDDDEDGELVMIMMVMIRRRMLFGKIVISSCYVGTSFKMSRTCWYEIEEQIFPPLSLHLDPEPGGRDPLACQLDQEVLLFHWPDLSLLLSI